MILKFTQLFITLFLFELCRRAHIKDFNRTLPNLFIETFLRLYLVRADL